MNISDVKDINAESGIIGTIIQHPEFVFHSDELKPWYFTDEQNKILYEAIHNLAYSDVRKIDTYNLSVEISKLSSTEIPVKALSELIDLSPVVARSTPEEYILLVKIVIDKAFRRETLRKLKECESVCFDDKVQDAQGVVYNKIEEIIYKYQNVENIEPMGKNILSYLEELKKRKETKNSFPWEFSEINKYCEITKEELIVLAAQEKAGKSIFLLNALLWALQKNKQRVLYIDTELTTLQFVTRMIAYMTKIPYAIVSKGKYTAEQEEKINFAADLISKFPFSHVYTPSIDDAKILTIVKKYNNRYGLDGIIFDCLKPTDTKRADAGIISRAIGETTDMLKNKICGAMKLWGLSAIHLNRNGEIANSAGVARSASTIMYLQKKTPQEIQADGGMDFGNSKLWITRNRIGGEISEEDAISFNFVGDLCQFKQAKNQPTKREPY